MPCPPHFMVVVHDPATARLVDSILAALPGRVDRAWSLARARAVIAETPIDNLIVEFGALGLPGLELISWFRSQTTAAMLVIGGESHPYPVGRVLEAGADDYIRKPFERRELEAHILGHVLHPATELPPGPEQYQDSELLIDLAGNLVSTARGRATLTRTEFRLLAELLENRGRVVTSEQLLSRVWGAGYESSRANLHVFIGYLRRKLEPDPQNPRYIRNHRGIGYEFVPKSAQ